MSMVLTRSPLEPIGMNGAGGYAKRRSARLSAEGAEGNEAPMKKTRVQGAQSSTSAVSTKGQDEDSGVASRKKRKVYDEDVDGFAFTKSKRSKPTKAPAVRNSGPERASPVKLPPAASTEDAEPKNTQRKTRRRLPTTPEREPAAKPIRRSKRLSNENEPTRQQTSPHKPAHARPHAKHDRSPSPFNARPVTVEKKRQRTADGGTEEKTMRIQLPFADTPIIKRNKEMRKASAETSHRRSSSGMRGRRASSLIDEGRGNEASELLPPAASNRSRSCPELNTQVSGLSTPPSSENVAFRPPEAIALNSIAQETLADDRIPTTALPHSEVSSADFFKHISAEVTEPRRMRCLLGWCGTRALPAKPDAPTESTVGLNLEFRALQAARVIQEELSQDLTSKGILSDWFSRDDSVPPRIPLRKKPNPRNVANAAKAEELERELERLKKDRAEWDELIASAASPSAASPSSPSKPHAEDDGSLSPLHPELLDSPQRAILEQLQALTTQSLTDPSAIQQRLRDISENLEFTVDQFAHGVHALNTTKETAERLADRSLADAAGILEEREKDQRTNGKAVDPMSALRGLAKVLNKQHRRS
ncbi:hypothetical protein LTR37_006701 [Vermiconidia calcicola]|uniref:Uncharacterized protein n=1 Tax=Vermiconidia calcicola TaxID=1690605 RepID=A0ACC3NI94_9PEZI|nr:hypothetical protein LTR37_006701 [Vermiconidia calcicola]